MGKIKFTLSDREFIAQYGDVILLSEQDNAVLENKSNENASLFYIAFSMKDGKTTDELGIDMISKVEDTDYRHRFVDINDTYLSGVPGCYIKAESLFYDLVYSLISYKLSLNKEYETDMRIIKAVQYININYYKKITVSELCRISGYSVSHLRRLFMREYGVSPLRYIMDRKIEMSKEILLEHPEKTVDEISELVGMCNTAYFCKIFKERLGVSPKKFKNQNFESDCASLK
jgi:AraC-like DNA-binding protein